MKTHESKKPNTINRWVHRHEPFFENNKYFFFINEPRIF